MLLPDILLIKNVFLRTGAGRNFREPRRCNAHAVHELRRTHLLAADERGVARFSWHFLRYKHARSPTP